uniref:HIG1 domain-containing protein n=1 Tax=Rhinolophus ferrumequinum TaxID=59479 RepID=A0A671EWM0_RHIFE
MGRQAGDKCLRLGAFYPKSPRGARPGEGEGGTLRGCCGSEHQTGFPSRQRSGPGRVAGTARFSPTIPSWGPSHTGIYSSLESFKEKFLRKTRENPTVPVGCLGTAAALTYGLYCFHRGQSQRSQLMMRTRIAAQGFTVAAILLGLAASALKSRS